MHEVLVNRLVKPALVKSMVRLNDGPIMTIVDDWDVWHQQTKLDGKQAFFRRFFQPPYT